MGGPVLVRLRTDAGIHHGITTVWVQLLIPVLTCGIKVQGTIRLDEVWIKVRVSQQLVRYQDHVASRQHLSGTIVMPPYEERAEVTHQYQPWIAVSLAPVTVPV